MFPVTYDINLHAPWSPWCKMYVLKFVSTYLSIQLSQLTGDGDS